MRGNGPLPRGEGGKSANREIGDPGGGENMDSLVRGNEGERKRGWIPACAGMTEGEGVRG
ncbi:MAG: hypothetical protein D8M59_11805 [Planctomycetes bacterium]|nr:hypothetical protein [Planctomycetota bacterium]